MTTCAKMIQDFPLSPKIPKYELLQCVVLVESAINSFTYYI